MSRTLNLAEALLARGRSYQNVGRYRDALVTLNRLAGLRCLPGDVALDTQVCLAEVQLTRGKFAGARRHLVAALVHEPDNARYHRLLGAAIAGDERGDPHRALEHFRKSLKLAPDEPSCLCEHGLLALRLGQIEEGVHSLHRAVEVAPQDAEMLAALVRGLSDLGRDDDAERELRLGMFRNARDPRFRELWRRFCFEQTRRRQVAERSSRANCSSATAGPTLLPFLRPVRPPAPECVSRKVIRRDGPGRPRPHRRGSVPMPDQRHA
jgi:Flp pilus assembly protein TadD